jgi:hypothetical protein
MRGRVPVDGLLGEILDKGRAVYLLILQASVRLRCTQRRCSTHRTANIRAVAIAAGVYLAISSN